MYTYKTADNLGILHSTVLPIKKKNFIPSNATLSVNKLVYPQSSHMFQVCKQAIIRLTYINFKNINMTLYYVFLLMTGNLSSL
jgi:hypothetical protein